MVTLGGDGGAGQTVQALQSRENPGACTLR